MREYADELLHLLRPYVSPRMRITPATPLVDRLGSAIDYQGPDACWPWMANTFSNGYGQISFKVRKRLVHRLVWEILVGPIEPGLEIDHLCRNRACCNPRHLEPVTHHVNLLRGETLQARNAAKTHCVHGHELTPENVYSWPGYSLDRRACRECRRTRNRACYAKAHP